MTVIDESMVQMQKQFKKNSQKIEKLKEQATNNEKVANGAVKFNNFIKKGGFLIPFLPSVAWGVHKCLYWLEYSTGMAKSIIKAACRYPAMGLATVVGALVIGATIGGVAVIKKYAKLNKVEELQTQNENLKEMVKYQAKENEQLLDDKYTKTVDTQKITQLAKNTEHRVLNEEQKTK